MSRCHQKYYRILIFSAFLMALSGLSGAEAGIGLNNMPPPNNHYAFPDTAGGLSLSDYDAPLIFNHNGDYLKYDFTVDSAKSIVVGKNRIADPYFAQPVVFSLDEYRDFRFENDNSASFRDAVVKELFKTRTDAGDGALKIEVPWRVRSKTFRKIFGGDRVGLRVTGNITINGGLRRQKSDQNYTTQNDQANYSFRIDQTQRFTIEGKVGDKVSVKVDQDSERMFDFENSLKLEYTGEEDEIIQRIEAGNVSLSLTGTQLATFSGKNTGLFGFKTESKLGPLKLTTIASVEKGQKNKKSLTGGAEETTVEINSTNIERSRYFFIDMPYRENFRYFDEDMNHILNYNIPGYDPILEIDVYKSVNVGPNTISQGLKLGWAMNSPDRNNIPPDSLQNNNNVKRQFKQLTKNVDYTVDNNLGYVRLNYRLNSNEVLSCAYTTATDTVGDYVLPQDSSLVVFKLIRPHNPQPSDSTWDLEFKNVYSLQASNIQKDGFELKVLHSAGTAGTDAETQVVDGEPQTYLSILGLDTRNNSTGAIQPDGILDDFPSIINWATGELIMPGLRPFDPDPAKGGGYLIVTSTGTETIISQLDSTTLMPTIYDTTESYPTVSKYKFSVKHKSASASYNLGFNVLNGSEEVFLNGARMKKGVDYNIDYITGNLTILNQAASSASANVEVLWESGEIFQLDKKTLLGVRGEYDLWNEESFFGTTALFLNEKPLEKRVKVGNEPTRNFILDSNSRMVFKTGAITSFLDFLPFLEAEAESEISLEGEVARVFPNPNSLNNSATGDNNGVAYLDDFESIKRVTSLGIMRRTWNISSIPPGALPPGNPNTEQNYMRGKLDWYNPYDQVPIKDIWPDREVNSQVASNVHVLNLNFTPTEDTLLWKYDTEESWAGIQRYLSAGYADQSKAKYLEVWVKRTGDPNVVMNFDLGLVSEDAVPNGVLNTEDKPLEGFIFGNGILDGGEDVGLDMMGNNDSRAVQASSDWSALGRSSWDFWDLDNNGVRDELESWSDDGYYYSVSNKNDYIGINGTEGNELDEGERLPDTEDMNNNTTLDLMEEFFRCSFTLPPPDSMLAGGNPNGWMQIRFPLKYADPVGSPSWAQIEYVRIWLSGCDDPANIQIATIELVGNEWEEVVDANAIVQDQERLAVTVMNTYDNPEYVGNQPPGVQGERDPITNILSREQSLVVRVIDLPPRSVGMVQRTFYSPINLLEYNTMKMFVRGGGADPYNFSDYDLNMFFRFGADTSSNYYEVYQRLEPGWAKNNEIIIDLEEIPKLKLERNALNAGLIDTSNTLTRVDPSDSTVGYWKIYYDDVNYDSIVVKGNPSLSQIRQLTIGLHNTSKEHLTTFDELEIWVDELRLSDVKKDPGTAYRASANIQLSDLGRINISISDRDPDFHSLEQRLGTGSGNSSQSVSGNFAVDRFLPPTWGLRLPFTGNFSRTTTTPKYYPGSDILLDTEDSGAVDTVKILDERKGWGISFAKAVKSTNPILKYTVDNLSAGYDYNNSYGTNPSNQYTRSNGHSANLGYNLTFGRDLSFGILGWAKNIPLLKKLKDTQLSYMPTRIQASISGTETISESLTRTQVFQANRIFNLNRSFSTGYRPFSVMSFELNRTHRSNMLDREWKDILNGNLGLDNNITQNFNASYAPVILNWLNHDINYSTNYQWIWGSGYAESGQSIQSNRTISTSWNLKTTQIFARKSTGRRGGREGRGAGAGETTKVEGEETKKTEEGKKKLNIAGPLKFIVSRFNDIRFDYTNSCNLGMPAVTGQAGWKYQLGLSENPEIGQVAGYQGNTISTRSTNNDYKVKSGLNIISNLRTNFDYSYSVTENISATRSGQYNESQYYTFTKEGKIKNFPFVNLTLRLTGLEKLSFFQNIAQTVSLESAYSGKSNTKWNTEKSNITDVDYDRNLSPLLGINISWKGGISTNIQYKKTQRLSDKVQIGQKSRSNNTTLSLTGNYSRKSGFKVPIPVWPFKNKRFKNNTTFSLTLSSSYRMEETLTGDAANFNITSETKQWSLMPKVDYTFSNTVTGGIHYETGVTENSLSGKTSFHEFGFNVNISIRGR